MIFPLALSLWKRHGSSTHLSKPIWLGIVFVCQVELAGGTVGDSGDRLKSASVHELSDLGLNGCRGEVRELLEGFLYDNLNASRALVGSFLEVSCQVVQSSGYDPYIGQLVCKRLS
jgi:hypothetical protein